MKRCTRLSAVPAAAALLFTAAVTLSCSKDNAGGYEETQKTPETFSFGAVLGESDNITRTALADTTGTSVYWSEGDAVSVFDNIDAAGGASAGGHRFDGTLSPDDATKATFSGELCTGSTEFTALYPYDSEATFSDGAIHTTIPSLQKAVAGNFARDAALSLASGSRVPGDKSFTGTLSFANLCSVIGFIMPSYIDEAQSVVVSANSGAALAGSVSIDSGKAAISSVTGGPVTLQGPLAADREYFICIVPGTYEGGFSFSVTTASGKTYSCATSKTLSATPGTLYYLGKPGVTLDFTSKVTIQHTTDADGNLNGSTATLSTTGLDDELAAYASDWTVKMYNADGKNVRNIYSTSGTMSMANSYTYLPQGTYSVETSYTLPDGRVKTVKGTATSPAPTFSVSTAGYTSYDWYAATNGCSKDISKANSLDGNTVYAPGTSVSIASELLSDNKYSSLYTYSYDGGSAVGIGGSNSVTLPDKAGQSWAQHSFAASCTFDGVTKSATRTLHVTGLPYRVSSFSEKDDDDDVAQDNLGKLWVRKSWNNQVSNSSLQCGGTSGSGTAAWRSDFSFYIPANVDINLSCPNTRIHTFYDWYSFGARYTTFSAQVSGQTVFTQQGSTASKDITLTYNLSGNGTLVPSNTQLYFGSSYKAAGPWVQVHYVYLTYR